MSFIKKIYNNKNFIYNQTELDQEILLNNFLTNYQEYNIKKETINEHNNKFNTNFDINTINKLIEYQQKNRNQLPESGDHYSAEWNYVKMYKNIAMNNRYLIKKPHNSIRILSYNVHSFLNSIKALEENNKGNDYSNAKDITELIKKNNIDIGLFQEYAPINNKIGEFFLNYEINQCYPNILISNGKEKQKFTHFDLGLANFCKKDYQIQEKYLYQAQDINGKYKRIYLGMRINDLIIFNVHLTWASMNDQKKHDNNLRQFDDFIYKINKDFNPEKDNIILLGDFNRTDLSLYSSNNFKNIKTNIKDFDYFSPNPTYYTGAHVDNIFVSEGFLLNYKLINFDIIPEPFSDHFPISLDIKLKNF